MKSSKAIYLIFDNENQSVCDDIGFFLSREEALKAMNEIFRNPEHYYVWPVERYTRGSYG